MSKYEDRSRISYNKKAADYDATFDGKFTVKFKEILCRAVTIKKNDTVADIACGNGRMLYMLAQKEDFDGYGVDLAENMIEQAKKLNPHMKFYVAGCDRLPFEKEKIHIMTVCAAFHHFPDVDRFAGEAERTIVQGGKLYIAEVYLPAILRWICNPFVRFSKAGDVRFYGPEEIAGLFEKHGFALKDRIISGKVQLLVLQKM